MSDHDYEKLGLVAGLEIHQQLETETKLFCACPTDRREPADATRRFTRYLHPARSELGEIDAAALEESRIDREFEYLAYDSTCLVEEDDEPPHRIDGEALATTLEIAQLLDVSVVDQAHVMRKVVIDGSNTGGFQRTMLVGQNGEIQTDDGPVGIEDLLLEEESAQRVAQTDRGVRFSLDRLGIPLVEIGTSPDIRSPEQAREAAEQIGMLLRSTGAVKRGLGTIRQDVNVSIADGARVEMKGVQSLDDIDSLVELEVQRQVRLLEIAEELTERGAAVGAPQTVTDVFEDTDSGVIGGVLAEGGAVEAVRLEGFDGLLGRELQPDRRLGSEIADYARQRGAGGLFHTDELPAYGVTEAEVEALRGAVGADADDGVVMVAGDPETAESAIEAACNRAEVALDGVPEETRDATPEATTQYLRPLPGAARMYPETDVPPVDPDPATIEEPELLSEKVERYQREYGLGEGLTEQVVYGQRMTLFESVVDDGIDATLAAQLLESTLTELRRDDVPVEALSDDQLRGTLQLVEDDEIAREGVPELLTALATDPELSPKGAAEQEDLGSAGEAAVRTAVEAVVERNADQVETEAMDAFSALMGECMAELRGKADGDLVSAVLREEIQARL